MTLTSDIGRVNRASAKSAVRLQEIGPRMTLQLTKVEEGLCSGGVIFNEYGMPSFLTLYLQFLVKRRQLKTMYLTLKIKQKTQNNVVERKVCHLSSCAFLLWRHLSCSTTTLFEVLTGLYYPGFVC